MTGRAPCRAWYDADVMTDFPPARPHGPITEVFPDVFFVTGRFQMGPGMGITRNMTVVRRGGELALVNAIRLTPEAEAELEKLGKVTHLVRIGGYHGSDDPYLVDRFRPTLWGPPRLRHAEGLPAGEELRPGSTPVSGSTPFVFEKAKRPEAALLIEQDGGVLITCDSYQNWTTFAGCSLLAKVVMPLMGFRRAIIGGPWAKSHGPEIRKDFERLVELPFRHLLPGHGTVLRDEAKPQLGIAMSDRFRA